MVSEAYSQGDIETNVFDWFNPPGQLSVNSAYAQFAPDITTDILNQNLKAIYDEARGLGEPDACSNFVSDTTDVLCAAILGADLIPDLENLVGFPTIVCHSPEDVSAGRPVSIHFRLLDRIFIIGSIFLSLFSFRALLDAGHCGVRPSADLSV